MPGSVVPLAMFVFVFVFVFIGRSIATSLCDTDSVGSAVFLLSQCLLGFLLQCWLTSLSRASTRCKEDHRQDTLGKQEYQQ